jgi:hypothetical protein
VLALEKKPGGAAPGDDASRDVVRERADVGGGGPVRCRACGHAVTTRRARIEVGGAHEHDFMNPAGMAFRIGCFSDAPGCRGVGEESTEWAWFPGHAWRIALCGGCFGHLGWSFRGSAGSFHGLVLDRLAPDDDART